MKYKILSTGTLCTCDGSRHRYFEKSIEKASALCWCQSMTSDIAARWHKSETEARITMQHSQGVSS